MICQGPAQTGDMAPSSITSVRRPHRGSVHGIALYRINSPDWAGSERKSAAVRLQRFVPPAVKIVHVEGTRMQRVRYPLRHLFAMRAYGGNLYFDMRGSAIAIAAQCSIRFFDDTQLFGEIAAPCKSFRGSLCGTAENSNHNREMEGNRVSSELR